MNSSIFGMRVALVVAASLALVVVAGTRAAGASPIAVAVASPTPAAVASATPAAVASATPAAVFTAAPIATAPAVRRPAAMSSAVAVPADVKIPAELTQQVTSLTARVGDTFTFKTAKDEVLGTLSVPAGTPGHGRIAIAVPAHDRARGTMSLQADSLDLPDGRTISVNIDASKPIHGHLSDSRTRFNVLPIPVGIIPISRTSRSGNLVLEPGTPFTVITTLPRTSPAPLLTAPPTPLPSATPTAGPSATPTAGPSATPTAVPSARPTPSATAMPRSTPSATASP